MRLFVSAGDPSGDLHASSLCCELKKTVAGKVEIAAIGGKRLKETADKFIEDIASLGVVGFWEPVKKLFYFRNLLKNVSHLLAEWQPQAVILVDYYGFNIHVAVSAKKLNIPVFYYISPQVWASRPGRIAKIKENVAKMLVIFPFEEKLYKEHGVPVSFVGHPILDLIPEPDLNEAPARIEPVIGLFPGSRPDEIRRHLPVMLKAARFIAGHNRHVRFLIFAVPGIEASVYNEAMSGIKAGFLVELVHDDNFVIRRAIDVAIASSGTITLENALLGVPTVVIYKLSWPTYLLARAFIKVKYIAMPNLLAGRELLPEFIQHKARPEHIAGVITEWLDSKVAVSRIRQELLGLRQKLGQPGAARKAAHIILNELTALT